MTPFSSEESARASVRVLQIIVATLVVGVLMFAAIAIFIVVTGRQGQQAPGPMAAYLAIGFAPVALGLRFVIGGMIAAAKRRRLAAEDEGLPMEELGDQFLMAYQQKTIVERALIEGALFFTLISFLVDRQWWSLAVAAVLLIGLVLPFPTYEGTASWVRHQVELVELNRQS